MNRIRSGAGRSRQQPRIGAPDPALTPNAGLAVITELCGRLCVIGALDTAVGPMKQRERGFGAGELLTGIAAAQLAGEDFLTGLDRQRADAAGQFSHLVFQPPVSHQIQRQSPLVSARCAGNTTVRLMAHRLLRGLCHRRARAP